MKKITTKAWPEFAIGDKYATEEVVRIPKHHLVHHQPKPPENPADKAAYIALIEKCGHEWIVWKPTQTGWGRSAWDPNCWLTVDGKSAVPNARVTGMTHKRR